MAAARKITPPVKGSRRFAKAKESALRRQTRAPSLCAGQPPTREELHDRAALRDASAGLLTEITDENIHAEVSTSEPAGKEAW